MYLRISTLLLATTLAISSAASAKGPNKHLQVGPAVAMTCAISDLKGATACSGYYGGNLNGGSAGKIADSQFALAALGFTWDGNLGTVEKITAFTGQSIKFSRSLIGESFVSVHYGAGQGPAKVGGGTTGFYKVDGLFGLSQLATRYGSLSNAILYSTKLSIDPMASTVPEPAEWAMLVAGFGLVGAMARRQPGVIAA